LLHARRLWVQYPIRAMDFSIDIILSAALQSWTQPLTNMSTRYLLRSKVREACNAGNLTAIFSVNYLENVEVSMSQNPMGLHGLLKGQIFLIGHWKGNFISFKMSLK
jgi:hypothetical protein